MRIGAQRSAVPMECCEVVPLGPIPATSLTPMQAADQIARTKLDPLERKRRVDEIRAEVNYEQDAYLRAWGVSVDPQPLSAEARVIPQPDVSYASGSQRPRINNGSWNLVGARFFQPGEELITWGVLDYSRHPPNTVEDFVVAQVDSLQKLGLRIRNTRPLIQKCRVDHDSDVVANQMRELARQFSEGSRRRRASTPLRRSSS